MEMSSQELGWFFSILVTLFIGAVGGLGGAYFKWLFDKKLHEQRNAFEMHRELLSNEMWDARHAGWEFLKLHPHFSFDHPDFNDRRFDGEKKKLWYLVSFFQRVSVARRSGFIDSKLIFHLFGELFVWWYVVILRDALSGRGSSQCQATQAVNELYMWLKSEAIRQKSTRDAWNTWQEAGYYDATSIKMARTMDKILFPQRGQIEAQEPLEISGQNPASGLSPSGIEMVK